MKTKTIKIEGKTYEVRELSMEEGMPLISAASGSIDIAGLIRCATRIDGKPAQEGEIGMGVAMKIMPVVMELNSFAGAEQGNA